MSLDPKGYERPTVEEVGRQLAKGKAPSWLLSALPGLILGIKGERVAEETARKPAELRDKLNAVGQAATDLQRALFDLELLSYLEIGGSLHMDETDLGSRSTHGRDAPWLDQILQRIRERALSQAKAIKVGRGLGSAFPNPEGLSARELCALVAFEVWRAIHGQPPGPRSEGVNVAAEMLWQAAGGAQGRDDAAQTGWRGPLEVARDCSEAKRAIVTGQLGAR